MPTNGTDSHSSFPLSFSALQSVSARVTGFRFMDGLAACSMKSSVLAQQVMGVKDIFPGQSLKAKVGGRAAVSHTRACGCWARAGSDGRERWPCVRCRQAQHCTFLLLPPPSEAQLS